MRDRRAIHARRLAAIEAADLPNYQEEREVMVMARAGRLLRAQEPPA